jgi:hypothetical protein
VTVTGTNTDFDGAYAYDEAAERWEKGETHWIEKTGGQWEMSDGTTTLTAPDNGLNVPPSEFTGEGDVPETIEVVGAGTVDANDVYIPFDYPGDSTVLYGSPSRHFIRRESAANLEDMTILWMFEIWFFSEDEEDVVLLYEADGPTYPLGTYPPPEVPPKTGWRTADGEEPAPTLEYDLPTITAAVSSATSVAPTADISQTAPEEPEGA